MQLTVYPYVMVENTASEPNNFRLMREHRISGSGQFTKSMLEAMKSSWEGKKVTIINLRQEATLFVNDHSLAWRDAHNQANKGKRVEEVVAEEKARKKELIQAGKIRAHFWKARINDDVVVQKVYSERSLVQKHGFHYMRYSVTDQEHPCDPIVDDFVERVRKRNGNEWFHIHCEAGWGRTTLFLFMVDAIVNATRESLETLLKRQVDIGGCNLTELNGDEWKRMLRLDRLYFAKRFYEYCKKHPAFSIKFSEFNRQDREKNVSP